MLAKLDAMMTACEGGVAWWVLPTYTMAQDVWHDLAFHLEAMDGISILKSEKTIYFEGGGMIAVRSGHEPDRLRGSGLDSVIIDEAAYCSEEVWHALRPALSDRNGKALLLSTPRGRNWFWSLYQKGVDPLESEWVSWRMPTEANPFIPAGEILAARQDMPERNFKAEYHAAFLDDAGMVFRGVRVCIRQAPVNMNEAICFGVDWGRMNDFTAVVVMGMDSRQVYEVTRFHQMQWSQQRTRLRNLAKRWRPELILAEANSIGSPNIEALREEGLPIHPFTTTSSSKAQIIDGLALAIESGDIGLPDDSVLLGELMSYEMQRMAGGDYRYSAPPNGHDDTVIALALALHAATRLPRARLRLYA
jgi:Terminase RNaseH-like domain